MMDGFQYFDPERPADNHLSCYEDDREGAICVRIYSNFWDEDKSALISLPAEKARELARWLLATTENS